MADIATHNPAVRDPEGPKKPTTRPLPTGATSLPVAQMPVDELLSGSLLFCRKSGPIQALTDIAGDVFRHVAVVEGNGTDAVVHEVARMGYRTRPIAEVMEFYEHIAVARLRPCEKGCQTTIADAASQQVTTDRCTYLPDAILGVIGALSLARAYAPHWMIRFVLPVVAAIIGQALRRKSNDAGYHICSSFVVDLAVSSCSSHSLMPELNAPKTEPHGDVCSELPTALAMPDDLWRSQSLTARAWLIE